MAVITIDDGTREYVLENKYGQEICKLHFRPADLSIAERYNQMRGSFDEIVKPLETISINADGTASVDDDIRVLHDVDLAFRRKINELLDMDDADKIFEKRNPFSSVGGRFFAEHILDAVGQIITETIEAESKASAARMSKYLGGDTDAGAAADKS